MRRLFTLFFVLLVLKSFSQHFPFPQHTYYHTHIKPDNYTQEQLDEHVKTFYDAWKSKYLVNGCEDDQYYVFFDEDNIVTVSEGMGYGMMIVPLMAGYDPDARMYFDGLYRYYKAHPSHIMSHLMAWKQITGCIDAGGPDSATDGDIDIAFGLLLAHAQWGSNGPINYFHEAELIIQDIMGTTPEEGDINQNFYSVKLGDWVRSGHYMKGTRTSDFITDHFKVFKIAVKDTAWSFVVDKCYALIDSIQTNYSPLTGLLPDFIDDVDTNPKPAAPYYLEDEHDGDYFYNACRDPWRLATDYLISGDERAKNAVLKIAQWLYQSSEGSVNNVYGGYHLDGTKIYGWTDISFIAPFAVGAMVDTTHQVWLNKLYNKVKSASLISGDYYSNTLKMLAMITISGNYWVPPADILNGIKNNKTPVLIYFDITGNPGSQKIKLRFSNKLIGNNYRVSLYDIRGKQILDEKVIAENQTLETGTLPSGIYILTLKNKEGKILQTEKVLK